MPWRYNVIVPHPMNSYNDIESSGRGNFQEKFAKQLSTFENMVSAESKRKKLGKAEIYDITIIPTHAHPNRVPGSRTVYDRPKGTRKVQREN